jgi:hypothetical protein
LDSHQRRTLKRVLKRFGATLKNVEQDSTASGKDMFKVAKNNNPNQLALSLWCLATAVTILFTLLVWSSPTPRRFLFSLIFMLFCLIYPVICLVDYVGLRIQAKRTTVIACRYIAVLVSVAGVTGLGWVWWPPPPLITMQVSPSSFPVSIPPHSVVSILRLHPNIILSDRDDYLLKDTNDTGKEFVWPSQPEIDSKSVNDRETVFHVEIANHSQETLVSGKLLFRLEYNAGSSGGCMPPKEKPNFQEDFVLIPQLDSGKSFDFYAVNQSPSCVWLIPPETALVRMTSDDTERQVALILDKNPLYSSGAPVFSPTTIKWEGLPTRPNGYQIQRIVH